MYYLCPGSLKVESGFWSETFGWLPLLKSKGLKYLLSSKSYGLNSQSPNSLLFRYFDPFLIRHLQHEGHKGSGRNLRRVLSSFGFNEGLGFRVR